MRTVLLLTMGLGAAALAQQTVAPSPEPAGGQNWGDYNVVNSFELGYRFHEVRGDAAKYRSDVNYGNGVRLLGSNLSVHSLDGHGRLFDDLTLRTEGLGNDPYQFSSLHIEKNRLYRYDFLWRLDDYFNPALAIAGGEHFMNTERRLQDHNLTLLPQSPLKLFVGYSRNSQSGPALSTVQLFSPLGDEFPLFENVRRLEDEYRLGWEINLCGSRFTAMHGWVSQSDETAETLTAPSAGNNPLDAVTLSQFQRTQPYRGSSPYWRLNFQKEAKHWAARARYSYAGSRRRFLLGEGAVGTNRFGVAGNLQTQVTGHGSRLVSAGDLNLTFFPASRLTIANQTSFYNTRMYGDNAFLQADNRTGAIVLVNFQLLGIRAIANTTDMTLRVAKWLAIYGGYDYSDRRIRSVQSDVRGQQSNHVHSGVIGLRLQPVRRLSVNVDAEEGRASHPIFPISDRKYRLFGVRVRYQTRTLVLEAAARSNYNDNSVSLSAHTSRARNYSFNASWTPWDWFAIDASYAKMHLNTLSGVAYFSTGELVTGENSIYVSNIHSGNLTARVGLGKYADLALGYSRVQDVGDGRSTAAAFPAAQTFPLTFESPLARLTVRVHRRLRWNAGYQFYRYRERFQPVRYQANTGYTSLEWSF